MNSIGKSDRLIDSARTNVVNRIDVQYSQHFHVNLYFSHAVIFLCSHYYSKHSILFILFCFVGLRLFFVCCLF